ncbi:unnamed protein product [Closterium sp. Yama58-4]|nr:unnamed protein product [Closterium sp. Yama58-4]
MPRTSTPVQPVIVVVGRKYCKPFDTVLVMKDRPFSTDKETEIHDVVGNLHFKLSAKPLSMRSKRFILDAEGQPVCNLVSKLLTLHDTTYLCPGDSASADSHLLQAKSGVVSLRPCMKVFLRGNTSQEPDIELTGFFSKRNYRIVTRDGILLAEVQKDGFAARNSASLPSEAYYYVRVLTGVDTALVLALAALADDMFPERDIDSLADD